MQATASTRATRGRTTFIISHRIASRASVTQDCDTPELRGLQHRGKVSEDVVERRIGWGLRDLRRAASRERPRISQVPRQQTEEAPAMPVIGVTDCLLID